MKTIEISEDALNTMKQMVEKLDADNKMLIAALERIVAGGLTPSFRGRLSDSQMALIASEAITKATK